MKKHNGWSYSPYKPLFFEVGDIYICRIAPDAESISLDWLGIGDVEYSVFCKIRGSANFKNVGKTRENTFTVTGLENGGEYEVYVCAEDKKSRIRLARCEKPVATVINYLHPEDRAYSFSGKYLCSPSLVRHPDGYLLASMDLFASGYPQNLTLIYRSDDDGKTWKYVSELFPCFWGKMFIHKGELYMLSVSTEYGDLLIGKSTDGGKTFTEPEILFRGSNGKNGEVGVHKNPQPVVEFNGRLWSTLEWGSWGRGYHAVMVMSAPVDSDLLDSDSWTFSEPVKYDPSWKGVAIGESSGNIEGSLVEINGTLYNFMRYDMSRTVPNRNLAVVYKVNTSDPSAPLEYDRCIEFTGAHSKFIVKYDPKRKKYFSIASRLRDDMLQNSRNLLSLMVSDDGFNWRLVRDIYDYTHISRYEVGFQYVDFIIEGDEIIFQCRTATNKASGYHDNNQSTFDRISIADVK